SSLLKIMAGGGPPFLGEGFPAGRIKGGFPLQAPPPSPAETRLRESGEGVQPTPDLLNRYDELNARLCEELSPEQMEKVLEEQGRVQDRIDQTNAWELESQLEQAMDTLRLRPADAPR